MTDQNHTHKYTEGEKRSYMDHTNLYVAVVGAVNDYTVYKSPSHWTVEACARNGDKVDKEIGERIFPEFKRAGLYWRW